MLRSNKILLWAILGLLVVNVGGYKLAHRAPPITTEVVVVQPQPKSPELDIKNCAIIGDSITSMLANSHGLPACKVSVCLPIKGKGLSNDPECTTQGSAPSAWIKNHTVETDVAIISITSNDGKDYRVKELNNQLRDKESSRKNTLETIEKTKCKICVLIRPALREQGQLIDEIAKDNPKIKVVPFTPGSDGIHPANLHKLAADIGMTVPELKNVK